MRTSRRSRRLWTLVLAGALLLTIKAQAAELVSRAAKICSSAEASHHFASERSLSADGRYIAFVSFASNLVAGQGTFDRQNVYLRDSVTGSNVLVSHKAGLPLTGGSWTSTNPTVSPDGSFVLFGSEATDLVSGQVDDGSGEDLFLWERATGTTVLISHAASSPTTAANGETFTHGTALLSADARYAVFGSNATDLVAGQVDTNGDSDVYLYDRLTGSNTLLSHASASASTTANDGTTVHGISSDGRYIVLVTSATDLVPGGQAGLYFYDRVAGTHTYIAPGYTYAPVISADGSFIAFSSEYDPVPGQTGPNVYDLYLYDRATGALTLVSHASSSPLASANANAGNPILSSDGRYLVFGSTATNLVAGQAGPNGSGHVFLYDRITGTNVLVDHAHSSSVTVSESYAYGLALSSDGRYVAFESFSGNLVAGQNGPTGENLFLYDRTTGLVSLVSHAHTSSQTNGRLGADSPLSMSADGRWISFNSSSDDLDPGDCSIMADVFLYDRQTGLIQLQSQHDPATPGLTGSSVSLYLPAAAPTQIQSGDGRFAVFQSAATNLLTGVTDKNDQYDIFLNDRETGEVTLVSRSAASAQRTANGRSSAPTISGDGRWVAFVSEATDLVPGQVDGNDRTDVFLYDRVSGTMTLASRNASSPAAAGNYTSHDPNLSSNGRYVAFFSQASNLVPGQVDTLGTDDVFVFDRLLGTSSLVSRKAGTAAEAAGLTESARISDDGRYVAFISSAQTLVAGAVYPYQSLNVFLHDRWAGTTILVSRAAGTGVVTASGYSNDPILSTDGRFLAFHGYGVDHVAGQTDTNAEADIFVYDRLLDAVSLVSHVPGAPFTTGNGPSFTPRISPEGTFVTFESWATDLLPGQTDANAERDIFLYDRRSGEIALVSHAAGLPAVAGNGASLRSPVSADGKVAFLSKAADLVDGQDDVSWSYDVFLYDPASGTNRLLSGAGSSETLTGGGGFMASISRNGRSTYFDSASNDLVEGDYNSVNDVFADHTPTPPTDFYTLEPCRLLDTRESNLLVSDRPELLAVHGACGVPATARALAVNVTALGGTGQGHLRFHEGGLTATIASTINFAGGTTRANNAILPVSLAERGLGVTPFVAGGGVVHLIVDVVGYFE